MTPEHQTTCSSCPFSLLPEAENALNLGCLPTPFAIMEMKRATGKNWPCHDDETRICSGFVQACCEQNIAYRSAPLGSYLRWYNEGTP